MERVPSAVRAGVLVVALGCARQPPPTVARASGAVPVADAGPRPPTRLPLPDGTATTLCGVYGHWDPFPEQRSRSGWHAVLRVEGGPTERLSLHPPGDFDALEGRRVCVAGTFYQQEPLHPGDPPYASRRTGWWLMDARVVDGGP